SPRGAGCAPTPTPSRAVIASGPSTSRACELIGLPVFSSTDSIGTTVSVAGDVQRGDEQPQDLVGPGHGGPRTQQTRPRGAARRRRQRRIDGGVRGPLRHWAPVNPSAVCG